MRRTFFVDVLLATLEGDYPANYFRQEPEMGEVLLDFFTWRNDPSAFPWHRQPLEWQQAMRFLSFYVWFIEQQAPKAAWGSKKDEKPPAPKIIIPGQR